MSAIGQSPAPQPTAQDLLTQAAMSIQGAVQIMAGTMQTSVALAQALSQVQAMLGQGQPTQPTLDDAVGGLQSDMQASAAQRGAY